MSFHPKLPLIHAIHDGRAGNARQALALAQALHPAACVTELQPKAPWRWLAPRRSLGDTSAFGAGFSSLLQQPPTLAIGCGRQAALATRLLRKRGSHCIQILDPRIPTRHWDLVIAPEHDGLHGDNVISILGSLTPVNDIWLAHAQATHAALAAFPTPHTVLLVGGPTRHAPLQTEAFCSLVQRLAQHSQAQGGSFSVVASRRTPEPWLRAFDAVPSTLPGIRWKNSADGSNPYAGLLAYATTLVCTPDSVNMLSEAAGTQASVYLWAAEQTQGRLKRFIQRLIEGGHARALINEMPSFQCIPLRETNRIIPLVRQRLSLPFE